MSTQPADLPGYEEIIASLANKLEGLSRIHGGLGEAAESLVLAHYEMEETKRRVEALAASARETLEEVKRLQPSVLVDSLDASLNSFSRKSSEGIGALSAQMLVVTSEVESTKNRVDEGLALLLGQVTLQGEATPQHLSELEESLTLFIQSVQSAVIESLDSSRATVTNSLSESEHRTHTALQQIQRAIAAIGERQDALSQGIADIQRQQGEFKQRQTELLTKLAESTQLQADMARKIIALAKVIDEIRSVTDTTKVASINIRHYVEKLEPALQTSLRTTQSELSAQVRQTRRVQFVSLILIVAAIALAWASLAGVIPTR